MTAHNSIRLRGTITECTTGPAPTCARWTYQRTAPGKGNLPGSGAFDYQRRRTVVPSDPRTPAQVARRATFREAVAEWQALPEPARATWRAAADGLPLSGYNLYISRRIR